MSQVVQRSVSEDPVLQWVTYKLAGEIYGVNVMQVQEVLRYTEITPVPGAPSYVLGIISLRGKVVTIIDTRECFGLQNEGITEHSRILVIEFGQKVIGILVDSVAEVVYIRQSEIEHAPTIGNEESSRFIQGVCYKNNVLLILVELDKILSLDEWSNLEDVA